MAYGIKVFNNTGGGVIDGYNFQLVFVGKISIVLSNLTNIWTTNGITTGQWTGTSAYTPWVGAMTSPFAFIGGPQTQSDKYGAVTLKSFALTNQALYPESTVTPLNPAYTTFSVSAVGDYALVSPNNNISLIRPVLTAYVFDILDTSAATAGYGLNVKSQRVSTDAYTGLNTFTTSQVPLVISAYAKTNGLPGLQTLSAGSIPTNWAVCMGHLGWKGGAYGGAVPTDGQLMGLAYNSPQTAYIDPAYYSVYNGTYNYSCPVNYTVKDQYMMWINRDLYD